jgi:hypothetical protein
MSVGLHCLHSDAGDAGFVFVVEWLSGAGPVLLVPPLNRYLWHGNWVSANHCIVRAVSWLRTACDCCWACEVLLMITGLPCELEAAVHAMSGWLRLLCVVAFNCSVVLLECCLGRF